MAAITNLYAKYNKKTTADLPIVLLVHGYGGDADSLTANDLERIANYGFFVASVGLRGRNDADGTADSSGKEVYDLYDALVYIRANYSNASATKAAIVGYSGGGGNALNAACKFPDYFNVIVDYFGMSDYGRDSTDGWWYQSVVSRSNLELEIGGTPVEVPNNYYARDATAAITNYTGGHLFMYHDKQDTDVPWVHSSRIKAILDAAAMTNYTANFSDTGDSPRWSHGYPSNKTDNIQAEPTWAAKILAQAAWTVPANGTLTVLGYMKNKRFEIRLGTLVDHAATVAYGVTPDHYLVTPLTGNVTVTITQGAKTVTQAITEATDLVVV